MISQPLKRFILPLNYNYFSQVHLVYDYSKEYYPFSLFPRFSKNIENEISEIVAEADKKNPKDIDQFAKIAEPIVEKKIENLSLGIPGQYNSDYFFNAGNFFSLGRESGMKNFYDTNPNLFQNIWDFFAKPKNERECYDIGLPFMKWFFLKEIPTDDPFDFNDILDGIMRDKGKLPFPLFFMFNFPDFPLAYLDLKHTNYRLFAAIGSIEENRKPVLLFFNHNEVFQVVDGKCNEIEDKNFSLNLYILVFCSESQYSDYKFCFHDFPSDDYFDHLEKDLYGCDHLYKEFNQLFFNQYLEPPSNSLMTNYKPLKFKDFLMKSIENPYFYLYTVPQHKDNAIPASILILLGTYDIDNKYIELKEKNQTKKAINCYILLLNFVQSLIKWLQEVYKIIHKEEYNANHLQSFLRNMLYFWPVRSAYLSLTCKKIIDNVFEKLKYSQREIVKDMQKLTSIVFSDKPQKSFNDTLYSTGIAQTFTPKDIYEQLDKLIDASLIYNDALDKYPLQNQSTLELPASFVSFVETYTSPTCIKY